MSWIEETFKKRDCTHYIPDESGNASGRCGCGREAHQHKAASTPRAFERWSIRAHTSASPTDAYGTIEFHVRHIAPTLTLSQGGHNLRKAQYVRVAHDTPPEHLMTLFDSIWKIQQPRLVITVHGGIDNFE
jgi:hypothetical protein